MVNYLPERVREARLDRGLTQRELARRVGTTEHSVANWESGRTDRMRLLNLVAVARVTGRSVAWLQGEDA